MNVNGVTVRLLREHRGLSLHDLSVVTNVPVRHLADIEQGARRPTRRVAKRIAAVLTATVDELSAEVRA